MKRLTKSARIFDITINSFAYLAALYLAFILLSVSAGVVMRYFVGQPLNWVLELSEYGLLYITFLAATWILKREGHVKIDLVLDRLTSRTRAIVNIITSIICILVCLTLVWYGSKITVEYFLMGRYEDTPLRIPLAYVLGIIPLGSFLLAIQFIRRTYGYWGGRLKSTDTQTEVTK